MATSLAQRLLEGKESWTLLRSSKFPHPMSYSSGLIPQLEASTNE